MNSVALPASASTTVPSAEADLVRQAARGDAEAFSELFRRHGAPCWRLAQAVTTDADAAVRAFRDGFARAVRSGRLTRRTGTAFRAHGLSSVYRAAIDQSYDRTAAPTPSRRLASAGPDAALTDAAFRSLPERWRAALWLSAVENFDSERIATVLGVSTTVAEQLTARAHRGLAGRFAQAHRDAPEHPGDALRPLALAMPADLAHTTSARWSSAGAERLDILAPVAGWLEDRATRSMSVAVGALFGLGLIALGVVPGGSTVRSELSASNPNNPAGSVRVCFGLPCPAGSFASGASGGDAVLTGSQGGDSFLSTSFPPSDTTGSFAGSGGGGGYTGGFGGSGGYGGSGYTPGSSSGPGTSTSPATTVTTPITVPTTPTTLPGGSTSYGVPGVITLTPTSTGGSVNLLGGTATATTGSGGVTVSTSTTVPSTTTTTAPTLISGATSTLNQTTSTITSTLSSGL